MNEIENIDQLKIGQGYKIIYEFGSHDRTRKFMEPKSKEDDIRKDVHLMAIVQASSIGKVSNGSKGRKYALFYNDKYKKYETGSLKSLGLIGSGASKKIVVNDRSPISLRPSEKEIKEKVKSKLSLKKGAVVEILKP